jgi:hypothetical protein
MVKGGTQNATYHNIVSYHLRAPLDFELLQVAIQQLVARHQILRTSFDLTHFSEPLQLVHREVDVLLPVEDVQHLSSREQDEVVAAGWNLKRNSILTGLVRRCYAFTFIVARKKHFSLR